MTDMPAAGRDGYTADKLYLQRAGDDDKEQGCMRNAKIILLCLLLPTPAWGGEANEVEALRKRVKELEVEVLKLRLNLADEKLVNARMEFNMLTLERSRICNELSAADQKTWTDRCTERGTK